MGFDQTFDLAFNDEALDQALHALSTNGDPAPALEIIASAPDADHREQAVAALGPAALPWIGRLRLLTRRQAYRPERWLLLGSALAAAGWDARGNAIVDRSIDRRIRAQQVLFAEARGALRQAAALSRDDPVPWSELSGLAFAAPLHPTEPADAFRRAAILAPDLFLAHARHLVGLSRKWGGNQYKVIAFALARTAQSPPGHPLHALVALAHLEGYVDGLVRGTILSRFWRAWRYFADPLVRRETDAASDRLLSNADTYATHPWSMRAHQSFGALYHQAGEPRRAKSHLERGGPRATVWPWRYFGDPDRLYTAARRTVGIDPLTPAPAPRPAPTRATVAR